MRLYSDEGKRVSEAVYGRKYKLRIGVNNLDSKFQLSFPFPSLSPLFRCCELYRFSIAFFVIVHVLGADNVASVTASIAKIKSVADDYIPLLSRRRFVYIKSIPALSFMNAFHRSYRLNVRNTRSLLLSYLSGIHCDLLRQMTAALSLETRLASSASTMSDASLACRTLRHSHCSQHCRRKSRRESNPAMMLTTAGVLFRRHLSTLSFRITARLNDQIRQGPRLFPP